MKLSKAELGAEILDVSVARFYELVRTGVLPAGVVVHLGRQIRVDEDALREWIKAGGQTLAGGWRRDPEQGFSFSHSDSARSRHRARK